MENSNDFYIDNRDMRDNNYQGPLVKLAPEGEGIPEDRALSIMKSILEHDIEQNDKVIAKCQSEIDIRTSTNKLILERLREFK